MRPYVFISYSHKDNIIEHIEHIFNNCAIDYWYDGNIRPSNDWRREIRRKIAQCELFLVVITEASALSENVIDEICFAKECNKIILPLFVEIPNVSEDILFLVGRLHRINIKKAALLSQSFDVQRKLLNSINDLVSISKLRRGTIVPPKIIVFDFDGTLANPMAPNTWELLWESVGYSLKDCDALEKEVFAKRLSYQEWCNRSLAKFSKKGMSKSHVSRVSHSMKTLGFLGEGLHCLKQKGVKMYILSGSIKQVICSVLQENVSYFEEIEANDFQFDNTGKLINICATKYNFDKKADYISKVAKINQISCSDILFVGNSFNDKYAYLSGAQTLCINPIDVDYSDDSVWTTYIRRTNDFREIIQLMFQ